MSRRFIVFVKGVDQHYPLGVLYNNLDHLFPLVEAAAVEDALGILVFRKRFFCYIEKFCREKFWV